jgi:hypothetical protein
MIILGIWVAPFLRSNRQNTGRADWSGRPEVLSRRGPVYCIWAVVGLQDDGTPADGTPRNCADRQLDLEARAGPDWGYALVPVVDPIVRGNLGPLDIPGSVKMTQG